MLPRAVRTQGIQFQADIVNPQGIPDARADQYQLRVDIGAFDAECLGADLVELSLPPFLRPFMAEHGALVPDLLRPGMD